MKTWWNELNPNQKFWISIMASIFIMGFLFYLVGGGKECGCSRPDVDVPSYADSWDDKESNWEFKECSIASSNETAEKIHVYVYFNDKMNKYRCQLLYSYPGTECSGIGKEFGANAICVADLSESDFNTGEWKTYDYWMVRQMY